MALDISKFQQFFNELKIPLRLSCKTPSGWPMILSLWYLYQDGRLYLATKKTARVVEYLSHEPRCAFEIAGDIPPYCGVRGQAKASIDPEQGEEILEKLLNRYQGGTSAPLAKTLLKNSAEEVAIILEPVNLFRWDFSKRMTPVSAEQVNPGVCP